MYAIVRSGKWRGPYIMDYLNCKQLKNAISCTWWCQNWWFQTKNVPWFVLGINKGAILPSDSGSLLHDIPSERCAYAILCYRARESGTLVSNCLHSASFYTIDIPVPISSEWCRRSVDARSIENRIFFLLVKHSRKIIMYPFRATLTFDSAKLKKE